MPRWLAGYMMVVVRLLIFLTDPEVASVTEKDSDFTLTQDWVSGLPKGSMKAFVSIAGDLFALQCFILLNTLVNHYAAVFLHSSKLNWSKACPSLPPIECPFAGNGNGLLYCIVFMICIDRLSSALCSVQCHFPTRIQTSIFFWAALWKIFHSPKSDPWIPIQKNNKKTCLW